MGLFSYELLASLLLYLVVARSMDRQGFSALFCATVVTLEPFLLYIGTSAVVLVGGSESLGALLS